MSRRASQRKSPTIGSHPIPSFQSDAVISIKNRYGVDTAASNTIQSVNFELPIAPFGVAYAGNALLLPFKAVRLAKLEMWSNYNPNVVAGDNTISFLTQNSATGQRPMEISATATFAAPAHIVKKFSKYEPIGLWYESSIGVVNPSLNVKLPKAGIMELTLDFILSDESSMGTFATTGLSFPLIYANQIATDLVVLSKAQFKVITM